VLSPVISLTEIRRIREVADAVYLDPKVEEYILDVVLATRQPAAFRLERLENLIEYGASPRATIYLAQAAKVHAVHGGRPYVTPQDVKTIGHDVLRHRVLLSYEAEAQDLDSDAVLRDIFNTVDVP
jgi:MoxR-like ATPase